VKLGYLADVPEEHLADPRSWNHGATGFFLVHLVLTVASLIFGTAIGVLGWRGLQGQASGWSGPASGSADADRQVSFTSN
jgi:hypothetical protein